MKLRKIAAMTMAVAMLGGTLAGCGGAASSTASSSADSTQAESTSTAESTETSGEKVNIKLFTGKIETIDVMNEIIDEFNASQDHIVVEQEYQKDASNVIKIKFASNEVPDIMTTYEQGFVDEGKYMDISDLNEFWDRMSPDMKAACTDVSLIEFLPHGYIKSTLGAVDAKKAFLANDQDKLQFAAADGPMAVFGEDLVDLQNKGLINADVLTATNDNCVQDFASGKAAMFSNGMWALSSVLEANPDMADKIGFAPYPAYMPNSKPVVLSAEDSGYCISATTEHKEECIEFLNFLFSPENQKKYSEVAKAPSAFTDVDAEWAPENVVKEVNAALKSAANIGFTNEKPAGFSGDDAGRMVQELLAGQYTPTEFAEAYEKAWTDGMAS